ncbi:hypothetical protein L0F63_005748, partial [Massospora cicadina]
MASPMHATSLICEKTLAAYLSNCLKKGIPWSAPHPTLDPYFHDAPTPLIFALCHYLSSP